MFTVVSMSQVLSTIDLKITSNVQSLEIVGLAKDNFDPGLHDQSAQAEKTNFRNTKRK